MLTAGVALLTSPDVPEDKRLDVALVAKIVGVSVEDLSEAVNKAKDAEAGKTEEKSEPTVVQYLKDNFVADDKGTAMSKLRTDIEASFPDAALEKKALDKLVTEAFGDSSIQYALSAARRYKIAKGKGGSDEKVDEDEAAKLPSAAPALANSMSVMDFVSRLQKRLQVKGRLASNKTPEEMKEDEDSCMNLSCSVSVGTPCLMPTSYTIQLKQSPIQVVENAGAFMYLEFPLEDGVSDTQVEDLITQCNTFANTIIPFGLGEMLPDLADEDEDLRSLVTATKLFIVGEINPDYLVSFLLERPADKQNVLRGTVNLGVKNPVPLVCEKMGMVDYEDLSGLISQDDTDDDLKKLFKSIDTDGDNKISFDEFCACVGELGVQMTRSPEEMFKSWDTDNDGTLDMAEFVTAVRPMYEPLKDMVTDPDSGARLKAAFRSNVDFDRLLDETYEPFNPSSQMHLSAAFGKKVVEAAEAFIRKKSKKWKRSRDQEKLMMFQMYLAGFKFLNKCRFDFKFGSMKDFIEPIGKAFLAMNDDGGNQGGDRDIEEVIFQALQEMDYATLVRGFKATRAQITKEFFEEDADETQIAWKVYSLLTTTLKGVSEIHMQVGQMGMNNKLCGFNLFQYFPRLVSAADLDALIKEAFGVSDQDADGVLKFEDCKFFVTRDIDRPFQTDEFKYEQYRSLCADWNADPEDGVTLEQFSAACKQQGDKSIVDMFNTVMLWEGKFAATGYEDRMNSFDGFVQGMAGDRAEALTAANEAFTKITGASAAAQVVEVEDEGYSS